MTQYVRYRHEGRIRHGRLEGGTIAPMDGDFGALEPSADDPVALSEVTLLSPTQASKIVAIGPNFRAHLFGAEPPAAPTFWIKPGTAVNDPGGTIVLADDVPATNHECELGVVIGRRAKDVPPDEAADYIFGYTCVNDVTAGDFSVPGVFAASHYFADGKIYDTFAPFGPHIETELDTSDLVLECRVNGEVRQRHSTADFIFTPAEVVAMASRVLTLLPGDVIAMGAPPGVAPLADGDVVEIEVEGIGVLRNPVSARPR